MITISRAKPEECQKILKLEQKVWNDKNIGSKWDAPTSVEYGYVFVAKDKGKIIGMISSIITRYDSLFITDWVVDKNYRKEGVGQKLYKKLINLKKPIIARVNAKNIPSLNGHKSLGFKIKKQIKDAYYIGENQMYYILERK